MCRLLRPPESRSAQLLQSHAEGLIQLGLERRRRNLRFRVRVELWLPDFQPSPSFPRIRDGNEDGRKKAKLQTDRSIFSKWPSKDSRGKPSTSFFSVP